MNNHNSNFAAHGTCAPIFGLAPFLRQSIAGEDLNAVVRTLLAAASGSDGDASLWHNLAVALQCVGERRLGLAALEQALSMQRLYVRPATRQPARRRLLLLLAPGDIAENAPLDCLLEDGDVDLLFYYASVAQPLPVPLPDHDAIFVAAAADDANQPLLNAFAAALASATTPVLNAPQAIVNTDRDRAAELLQGIPGLCVPPTRRLARAALADVAVGRATLPDAAGFDFPVIVRPLGSHAGRDLERADDAAGLADYLARIADAEFFVAPFVDYSGADGLFRKFRVALIDGRPYACHMGISRHWIVHYVNAGMYEDAAKRAEEAGFMTTFDEGFAARHAGALAAIAARLGLDYVCLDCAETRSGELLLFEADHVMVVHAMDPPDRFPYKQPVMARVAEAFRGLLERRCGAGA